MFKMNNSDKLKQEINNKCMEIIKEVYIIKYMFIDLHSTIIEPVSPIPDFECVILVN